MSSSEGKLTSIGGGRSIISDPAGGVSPAAPRLSSDADVDLDPYLALSLAGHAFFAYKEPKRPLLRQTIGVGEFETEVDLLDKNFVLRSLSGGSR